jgi:hypothetical protein
LAWQVGNLWNGDLGYGYKRDLSSFEQQLTTEKDMRTTHTGFFNAGYQIHPDWKMLGAFEYGDTSYQERDFLDRDTTSGTFAVLYSNTRNTRVGVSANHAKNDLRDTNIAPGISVDNDYDTTTISGVFRWQGSVKSALEARLGYTYLRYDDLNDRDFEGSTGRLKYKWGLTAKTKIDFDIWRETTSLYDEITSYVLQKGISIKPAWSATPKISITGEASYTNDDFKGRDDIVVALGGQRRDDDTFRYSIGASWQPRNYFRASLNYRREERDSSIDGRDYDNDQVDATVRFDF